MLLLFGTTVWLVARCVGGTVVGGMTRCLQLLAWLSATVQLLAQAARAASTAVPPAASPLFDAFATLQLSSTSNPAQCVGPDSFFFFDNASMASALVLLALLLLGVVLSFTCASLLQFAYLRFAVTLLATLLAALYSRVADSVIGVTYCNDVTLPLSEAARIWGSEQAAASSTNTIMSDDVVTGVFRVLGRDASVMCGVAPQSQSAALAYAVLVLFTFGFPAGIVTAALRICRNRGALDSPTTAAPQGRIRVAVGGIYTGCMVMHHGAHMSRKPIVIQAGARTQARIAQSTRRVTTAAEPAASVTSSAVKHQARAAMRAGAAGAGGAARSSPHWSAQFKSRAAAIQAAVAGGGMYLPTRRWFPAVDAAALLALAVLGGVWLKPADRASCMSKSASVAAIVLASSAAVLIARPYAVDQCLWSVARVGTAVIAAMLAAVIGASCSAAVSEMSAQQDNAAAATASIVVFVFAALYGAFLLLLTGRAMILGATAEQRALEAAKRADQAESVHQYVNPLGGRPQAGLQQGAHSSPERSISGRSVASASSIVPSERHRLHSAQAGLLPSSRSASSPKSRRRISRGASAERGFRGTDSGSSGAHSSSDGRDMLGSTAAPEPLADPAADQARRHALAGAAPFRSGFAARPSRFSAAAALGLPDHVQRARALRGALSRRRFALSPDYASSSAT